MDPNRKKKKAYIVIRFFGQKVSVLMFRYQLDDRHQRFVILHGDVVRGLREQFRALLVPFAILRLQTGRVRRVAQLRRFRLVLQLLLVLLLPNMLLYIIFEVVLCGSRLVCFVN